MSRPLSWLDQIYPISKAVAASARSHYDRRDLEQLFSIQPRSAQNLMSALPTVSVGRANLVERDALLEFLSKLQKADDPGEFYARLRATKIKSAKRTLKKLVLEDVSSDIDSLPSSIALSVREVRVQFNTIEELVEALMRLAIVLDKQLDEFVARYQPKEPLNGEAQAALDREKLDREHFLNWRP